MPVFWMMPVFALAASTVVNITNPFTQQSGPPDISGLIISAYNFALMAAGGLAMGAIVYGAILYTISSGNPSKQSDAKEWITQALLGLFLLLAAFIIFTTINPSIANLEVYGINKISTTSLPITTAAECYLSDGSPGKIICSTTGNDKGKCYCSNFTGISGPTYIQSGK